MKGFRDIHGFDFTFTEGRLQIHFLQSIDHSSYESTTPGLSLLSLKFHVSIFTKKPGWDLGMNKRDLIFGWIHSRKNKHQSHNVIGVGEKIYHIITKKSITLSPEP